MHITLMVWYLQLCMSSAHFLRNPYGFWVTGFVSGSQGFGSTSESDSLLASTIEIQIQKINDEVIIANIQIVFDEIIKVIDASGKTFNRLLFENQQAKIARYFQIVFYAFYNLIIDENMEVSNTNDLIDLLDKSGDKTIKLAAGGGNWSAKEKQTQSDALTGVIRKCFVQRGENDPARNQWITRFENILMQSSTEQTLYDFKVGLHPLHENAKDISMETFSKIVKTLTSMANTFPHATGYCILGVADGKATAERHKSIFGKNYISYSSFRITGINDEAEKYHDDTDKYFTKIVQFIKSQPISDRDKDNLSRNITTVKYFSKELVILKIESDSKPSIYDGKYYVRHGSNIDEVQPENFAELFARFQS